MNPYVPAARTWLPWHAADSVRRAREELVQARRQWQQLRPQDAGEAGTVAVELTEDQLAAQERVMWSDVVYHAAVNAAMRAEFLVDAPLR